MEMIAGPKGSECFRIEHESGAVLTVARHGGHLISWTTADGTEQLYLSPKADFSDDKAIRGGVPVIFPQFSDHGPFGRHGFARKSLWEVCEETGKFTLTSSDETLAEWPHPFSLSLEFTLTADSLMMALTITNLGESPFEFHAALHTYFGVPDVEQAKVTGLEGLGFLDEAANVTFPGEESPISFGLEVDRAYFGGGEREVSLASGSSEVTVFSEGFPDVVIWNPGPGHGIGDLDDEGWRDFVCVESAQVENLEVLKPGRSWTGRQKITTSSAL